MTAPEHRIYLKRLLILLALVLGARWVMAALLPLSPQEAYYWVFSLHPAWSYFDHPPLTAYVIGFFTYFLGDRAIAIRLGALLFSFGFSLLAYRPGEGTLQPARRFLGGDYIHLTARLRHNRPDHHPGQPPGVFLDPVGIP